MRPENWEKLRYKPLSTVMDFLPRSSKRLVIGIKQVIINLTTFRKKFEQAITLFQYLLIHQVIL